MTRCTLEGEVFICDVSLVSGKILIQSVHRDVMYEVRVSDVMRVYQEDDTLVVETPTKRVFISTSGPSSPLVKEIGRVVELRVRYAWFSAVIKDLLINAARAFQALVSVVKSFHEDIVGRWIITPQLIGELYIVSENLNTYGINIKHYVDELSRNAELRSVQGVKRCVKELAFNMVRSIDEFVKTLLTFEDLRPLLSLVVLAYVAELAYWTNQPLEAKKAEEDLLRECSSEIHVKMLGRPEVDVCRSFVEVLRDKGSYEAVRAFIDGYLKLLNNNISRLLGG